MSTKIPWRKPTEVPRDGAVVWFIEKHWKGHNPLSYELAAGEVKHGPRDEWRITNLDYTGHGSPSWYPEFEFCPHDDTFIAWAYADEADILPDFVTNN